MIQYLRAGSVRSRDLSILLFVRSEGLYHSGRITIVQELLTHESVLSITVSSWNCAHGAVGIIVLLGMVLHNVVRCYGIYQLKLSLSIDDTHSAI